ncbi:histidine kinase [Amycolatopsis sp. OK19-0408]|uniref:histidine kinase n=1 Tax=Amycolatopsis iheyensis TaxID=2945988 RepID=A0A9X2SQZ9_9PSEU|nr:histidine kinase [Amycolatopsis iheyensis]MCR6490463.1 histidine kinase [Amycolatopsis iheyensis]
MDKVLRGLRLPENVAPGWLVVQLLGSVVILATLLTTAETQPLVWVAYGAAAACWVGFVLGHERLPRTAAALLAAGATVVAPVISVASDTSALVIGVVMLGRFAALITPGVRLIVATGCADIALCVLGGLLADVSLGETLGNPLGLVIILLFGLNRRQYRIHLAQTRRLLEQTKRAQAEQTRAAALDERTRIAREIHDVLANSLGALVVQLELAEAMLEQKDDDRALERVLVSRRLAVDGLAEARNAVAALRADVPPLARALEDLAQRHHKLSGTEVSFGTEGELRTPPFSVVACLVALAREALTNAAKHAPGEPVTMVLGFEPDRVRLTVRNPVAGDPGAGTGFGLTGMRERVSQVGGRLSTGTCQGEWQVVAEVPEPGHTGGDHG